MGSRDPIRVNSVTGNGVLAKVSLALYVKLVLVALFWGGTFIAGRIVALSLPMMIAATGRFLVAVSLLLIVAWKLEGGLPRLNRQQLMATAGLGLTGIFIYNLCFFSALSRMPAGRTALFVALNPIVTALASALVLRERLSAVKWLGIALAFSGAAIVITRGDLLSALYDIKQSVGLGEVLMFCAISGWAAYTIIGRYALKSLSPIAATTYAGLWGLCFLICGSVTEVASVEWSKIDLQVWASIFYLGVFGTVIGFIWYYEGVKIIGPSRTAIFNNLVPVFGILLASFMLSEPVLNSMIVGGILTIIGVALTNR